MDQPGLLEWCNATRFAMANDPGRPLFKDQIHTHGFLFLDNYLDNILAGPRRDPLIELVKTPGRKKAVTKQRTVGTTTLKSVISVSLENEEDAAFKENVAPVNSFHQALLRAKEKPSPPPHDRAPAAPTATPVVVAPARSPSPPAASGNAIVQPHLLVPTPTEQNDLSIIVEDDETDGSRVSLRGGEVAPAEMQTEELPESTPMVNTVSAPHAGVPSPVAADIPATPLSPLQPLLKVGDFAAALPENSHRQSLEVKASEASAPPLAEETPSQSLELQAMDFTVPLPEIPPWQPRDMQVDVTEPLPAQTEQVMTPTSDTFEMQDVVAKVAPISPKGLTRKPSVPSFPSLPAPLPFRKSFRAPPEPSVVQASATPGAALGGKRTSWLMRAREVKALEITVKKPIPAPPITPGISNANKRKSDLFGATGLEEEERKSKVAKNAEGDVAPLKPKLSDGVKSEAEKKAETPTPLAEDPGANEGLLLQLKRTVDGLGSKALGKSVGGTAAANALAVAMAAAKVRVAERNNKEEEEEAKMVLGTPETAPNHSVAADGPASGPAMRSSGSHLRLSVSELVTSSEYNKSKEIEKPVVSPAHIGDHSSTTTPPDSPPPVVFCPAPAPVFNKPPPVFVPPAPPAQPSAFKMPVTTAFSKPASMTLGLGSRLPSPKQTAPLSAQSTLESVRSDALFDSQDTGPAWMPTTQDTEYTSGFGSQSQCSPPRGMNDLDEDDSWPLEERIKPWFDINAKEDSITWSTLSTESQRGDTGPIIQNPSPKNERSFQPIPGSFTMDVDEEGDEDGDIAFGDGELDEMKIDPLKSTVSLVDPTAGRSGSQMSMASSSSLQSQSQSQAQGGFLSQASKLVSSVLGSSKKGKPEVKSLQLAAVAAKKEQEEKEKKANRLKEMEARRQAALQRKADEEKAKAQDEERKLKEESERRKKEREDTTDKRPLKTVGVKKDDEQNKKRKIIGELDKKQELKKPMPKAPVLAPTTSKFPSKFGKPQPALASSATYNAASSSKAVPESNLPKSMNGKGKLATKNAVPDDDISQPSQILQSQMAARAKAQLQAANLAAPTIASESIELPDINSEYSDSEDEDRPRTFDPPSWAQSPDLRQALEIQSTINPDDIFGAIRPLRMDELFQNRTGRFRARTSSANWTGTDRLTIEEEREYARRMGFR